MQRRFDPAAASLAFAALYTFMLGQIDVDSTHVVGPMAATMDSVTVASALTRDEVFEFGFDAVIEGLKLKLRPQPVATRRSPRRPS